MFLRRQNKNNQLPKTHELAPAFTRTHTQKIIFAAEKYLLSLCRLGKNSIV